MPFASSMCKASDRIISPLYVMIPCIMARTHGTVRVCVASCAISCRKTGVAQGSKGQQLVDPDPIGEDDAGANVAHNERRGAKGCRDDCSPTHKCPVKTKRVALAFYGLTRSLSYTIDSIRRNIMKPLAEAGYTYDVYLHTYDLQNLANERSGEANPLNTTEWKLLEPDFHKITSQVRHPG
jgi:hypothetical protein